MLGLSLSLARQQQYGSVPAQDLYAAFTGAFGIFASVIGVVPIYVKPLKGVFTWILDGVSSMASLAAGMGSQYLCMCQFAEQILTILRLSRLPSMVPDCGNTLTDRTTWHYSIINGGCYGNKSNEWCTDKDKLHSRCVNANADVSCMYLACLACFDVFLVTLMFPRD